MALKFKRGVRCRGVSPETVLAMVVSSQVYEHADYDCIITSIGDGRHRRGSLHYIGHAFDCRVRHLQSIHRQVIADEIRARLSPLGDFDVVYEDSETENAHIHVEYQPKGV